MIVKNIFGTTKNGETVDVYTLRNSNETAVDIITYGATVNSIYVADKNGVFADVLSVPYTLWLRQSPERGRYGRKRRSEAALRHVCGTCRHQRLV